MGRQSWISILGLYDFDNTIFDDMYLPDGMDKDLLINNLLLECAELEVLLPDAGIMKKAIGFWSHAQATVWDKLYDTTQFEYNPIWNKDGIYHEVETHDLTATRNLANTDTGSVTNQRSAYNSSSFQNQEKDIRDLAGTDTGTVKDSGTLTRDREEHGNIGVTTTQQMIKEEREVDQFNMYDYIVRSFKERFCIMVY